MKPYKIVLSVVTTSLLFFFTRGLPLPGLPKETELLSVTVEQHQLNSSHTIINQEQLHLARNLANIVTWQPGTPLWSPLPAIPKATGIFIAVNENTMYCKGCAYKIKGNNGQLFLNAAEGLFSSQNCLLKTAGLLLQACCFFDPKTHVPKKGVRQPPIATKDCL